MANLSAALKNYNFDNIDFFSLVKARTASSQPTRVTGL
jgi:hypothetical protein